MKTSHSRRQFIRNGLSALAGTCLTTNTTSHMALAQAMAGSHSFTDYKALVCVFLYGGNDSFNMLVPTETAAYAQYQDVRQDLAYDTADLLSLDGVDYAVPSAMTEMQSLFNDTRLAFVTNMGTLLQPVTKAQIRAQRTLAPEKLFSHNSQQRQCQQLNVLKSNNSGWAGRMSDLLYDGSALPVNYNISGSNVIQVGRTTQAYGIGSRGPSSYYGLRDSYSRDDYRRDVFNRLVGTPDHLMEKQFYGIRQRTNTINTMLSDAFDVAPVSGVTYPEDNRLADQLEMIAKIISVRGELGQKRQIFFASMGGWDTHDEQVTKHPSNLRYLSEALGAFYAHLSELGMTRNVTTFTMSEFGRTLSQNNDGTDHGWGGHQMVFGGAVNGGQLYGTMPSLELGSDDDWSNKGRMIPTTSVEQFASPMASWFGLSDAEVNDVFPRLSEFDANAVQYML